jgi:hypothetical protein
LADFEISDGGASVTCTPAVGTSEATISHLFQNQVLPLALNSLGKLVFHASSVELSQGAIAFVGISGRGKSTLATAFAKRGYGFLTDDALVLDLHEKIYRVQPMHPSVRLWEDSRQELLGDEVELAPSLEYTRKARALASSVLTFCHEPRPLIASYVLGPAEASGPTISRLFATESMIAWAGHSFLLDLEDQRHVGEHFDRLALLSQAVPSFSLDYPRTFRNLDKVVEVIVRHADEQGARNDPR